MATTYLDITNEVLRELNEIPLTSANFANAVGLQQFVKDSVNKSIFDIANAEPQLPFFAVGESGATDPFYGNTTVASVIGFKFGVLSSFTGVGTVTIKKLHSLLSESIKFFVIIKVLLN